MLVCHVCAKQASPKELEQMPQMCNFEAPDLAAWASALSALNHTNFSRALAAHGSTCEQSTAQGRGLVLLNTNTNYTEVSAKRHLTTQVSAGKSGNAAYAKFEANQ